MTDIRVTPVKTSYGYRADTDPEYLVLGMWIDEADEEDLADLWREIGARTRGERGRLQKTTNDITIRIDRDVELMHFQTTLAVPLLDFARATESWFAIVAPPIALALRQIRGSWAIDDSAGR